MACPCCDGSGCKECKGGQFEITGCPNKFVTRDIRDLMTYGKLYELGLPPVAGGALDQTRAFTDGCLLVQAERRMWEAEG